MKLTDKRFWSGDKTDYYSFFKYALSDSVLFSISWTLAISLILCLILLIIGLHNEESISWHTISVGLIFLFIVFIISNGMFLYENWVRQYIIIGKVKKLLPEGCAMKSINFYGVRKEYKVMLKYKGKMFRATIEYPFFYLSESGVRALGALNIGARKCFAENKSLIMDYMS
ncbi:hypothetical protein [uncultured Duncaniella sp.]|uniref:hypothetical protein n=1 Tax=uncultured Duncaniella sp. TaxID=2768039 RepID=UPI000F46BE3C|nr:hypothetical protein [uncultured Duncaniella sp.]ROS87555.1 hypothetical protein EEL39_09410 [Muribaculaceae bacterium Isolate-080 (Janvier)]